MNRHGQKWISSQNRNLDVIKLWTLEATKSICRHNRLDIKASHIFSFYSKSQDRITLHPGKMCAVRGHQLSHEDAGSDFYYSRNKSLDGT